MHRIHQIEPRTFGVFLLAIIATCFSGPISYAQNVDPGTVTVELQTSLPQGFAGHTGGLIENKLVCIGGTSWSDDRQTKKWHDECLVRTDEGWVKGPSLPQPLSDAASAFDTSALYLVGGINRMTESRDVYCLASIQGVWKSLAPLPISIQGACAALVDGTLYVVGGKSEGRPQTRTWALELSRQDATWRSLAAFPGAGRSHSAIVTVDHSIVLLGGFTLDEEGTLRIFDDAYRYDPKGDQWTRFDHIHVPGYAWAASPLTSSTLLIVGRVRARGEIRTDVEVLDLTNGQIQTIGHLAVPTCVAPLVRISDERWIVFGGEPNANRNRNKEVQLLTYHPARK